MCSREIDVFVTKPETDYAGTSYEFDDDYLWTVQSCIFNPAEVGGPNTAYIVQAETNWLIATYSVDETAPHANRVEVGDLLRVGSVTTSGYTDYLTVLETKEVSAIHNSTASNLQISRKEYHNGVSGAYKYLPSVTVTGSTGSSGDDLPPTALTALSKLTVTASTQTVTKGTVASLAIRINMNINATDLPDDLPNSTKAYQLHGFAKQATSDGGITGWQQDLETRSKAGVSGTETDHEGDYYPLYKAKQWVRKGRMLTAELPSSAQKVTRVKLMGYTLMNKRQPSINVHHEISSDDFLILKIKEFHGRVISNNQFANGAFAILQAGTSLANKNGVVEVEQYFPEGYADVLVNQPVVCRSLTLEVLDRLGRQASFGRLHVWLKLTVEPN